MRKKRILIVDDSVVIRRSLAESLARDPDMEVAGSAPNGRIALMKIPLLCPDVIALDIDMPEMSGLETLTAILKSYPQLTVIMLNVPTDSGAAATLDALTLGARDYVTKPDIAGNSDDALRLLSDEFIAKATLHCPHDFQQRALVHSIATVPRDETSAHTYTTRPAARVDVVAIGVSTGGPNALMELIPQFPSDFPVPILIVQHMPPIFTKFLAERLAARCKIRVAEGSSHQRLLPGDAWIAPGDFHMALERDGKAVRIRTYQGAPENSCRPAADVLFRSVAKVYGPHALAVVMTGMGQDGFRGCQQISAAGGQVLAQDEASSVIWGMPGLVAKAGLADEILPLDELGPEIMARISRYRLEKHALISG